MLTISKPLSSGQAQSYHKLEFTSETQNYYKQGDAVRGEWQGQLAARLGVSGEVSPLEFSRLAEGKNPTTDEQMVRHRAAMEYKNADGSTTKSVEHRAGWDATFSAPKSVSLTALVGGDDRVREAHRAAVTTALEELERYTQARIGSNHPAESTGKFIAAKFEHDTARPVDGYAAPQLHTHAVIFNVTERADGTTRAVQPQGLFDSQNFATAVYQSELTHRLARLGYEIEPGRSGAPEIKGYSQEYLDASSPRSRQIKEQLEKTGYSGPEAAQIAAHSTRDRKQPLTAEEVLSAHRDMAASFGDQPHQVIAAARVRAIEHQAERTTSAKEAVTFARERIFEREAVADERLILRDALRRGMGETTYRDIRTEFDQRREAGDFSFVRGTKHSSGHSFTTPDTIAAERANIRYVLDGRNAVEPIMSAESAREHASTKTSSTTRSVGSSSKSLTPATAFTDCKDLPAQAKRAVFSQSAKERSLLVAVLKDLLPHLRLQASSARLGLRLPRSKVSLPVDRIIRVPSPPPGISTCSTSPVSRVQNRCAPSSVDSVLTTASSSSGTPGSIRAWMQDGHSSRCRRPECRPRNSTRSCARKTPNCSKQSSTLRMEKLSKGSRCLQSRGASPRFRTDATGSPPLPRTMPRSRRTRSSSHRTTAAASRSMKPLGSSCVEAAHLRTMAEYSERCHIAPI